MTFAAIFLEPEGTRVTYYPVPMTSRDTLGTGIGLLRMNTTSDEVELDAQIQVCMHMHSLVFLQYDSFGFWHA